MCCTRLAANTGRKKKRAPPIFGRATITLVHILVHRAVCVPTEEVGTVGQRIVYTVREVEFG